jgi:diguanylate cyclase (GGDEF)-like protein
VRESDTVGRIGGDEFAVLLHDVALPEHALAIAEKIRAALEQPFDLGGERLQISASIGIALCPEHGDDNKQLIRLTDEAMYAAKKAGGNRVLMAALGPGS